MQAQHNFRQYRRASVCNLQLSRFAAILYVSVKNRQFLEGPAIFVDENYRLPTLTDFLCKHPISCFTPIRYLLFSFRYNMEHTETAMIISSCDPEAKLHSDASMRVPKMFANPMPTDDGCDWGRSKEIGHVWKARVRCSVRQVLY